MRTGQGWLGALWSGRDERIRHADYDCSQGEGGYVCIPPLASHLSLICMLCNRNKRSAVGGLLMGAYLCSVLFSFMQECMHLDVLMVIVAGRKGKCVCHAPLPYQTARHSSGYARSNTGWDNWACPLTLMCMLAQPH